VVAGEEDSDGPCRPVRWALTRREREVLRLVAGGLASPQIAARLGVARCTVDSQVRSAMDKLGARSRVEAAARAASAPAASARLGARLPLEPEQRRALELLAGGATLAEAGAALGWSPRTIGRRLAAARVALGVATTAEAVARLTERI
jgi:DNA-binding NarL/FixJ family response regulator